MSWREKLVGIVLVALVVALPTQVTLRQLAMRVADVRTGIVTQTEPHVDGVRITDHFATWADDALVGLRVRSDAGEGTIKDSGYNWFVVAGAAPGFDEDYVIGATPDGSLARLAGKIPRLPVTPAAVLVVLLAVLQWRALWRWVRSDWWRRVPVMAWVALLALVVVAAKGGKTGIKELLQLAEFATFLVVLGVTLRETRWRDRAVGAVVGGALLVGLVGVLEYWLIVTGRTPAGMADLGALDSILGFDWQPSRPYVRGTEASRNALAFYAVLVLPFLALVGTHRKRRLCWRGAAVAAAAVLVLCTQNLWLLVVGVLAVTLAVGMVRERLWMAVPVVAVVVVAVGAMASPLGLILADSAAIHRYEDTYGLHPQPMRGLNGDDAGADWSPWQQKAIERQAAINAVLATPLAGNGLGRYQEVINQYYSGGPVPALWLTKPPVNLMERDAHSLWLVLAVEGGILLPLVLVLAILAAALAALRRYPDRAAQAALWLALAIVLVMGGWISSFMVRGLFGMTALLIVLASGGVDSRGDGAASEAD